MAIKTTNDQLDPNSPSLLERTKYLLATCGISASKLAIRTGLSYYWIRQMQTNENKSASVDRVQHLYEYLSDTELFPDAKYAFQCDSALIDDES